jgi:hypothetical protein
MLKLICAIVYPVLLFLYGSYKTGKTAKKPLLGGIFMTQTTQFRTLAVINEPGKNPAKNKPETEDNMKLLLTVYDNLNELYERLNRLGNIIEKRASGHKNG